MITVPFALSADQSLENGVINMVYIPVSNCIACIDLDRKVSYIGLESCTIEKQLQAAYDGQLTSICLSEIRHEIAVGDESGEIKIFNNLDGKLLHIDQMSHGSAVTSLTYSPDGTKLISGDHFGKILIWRINQA